MLGAASRAVANLCYAADGGRDAAGCLRKSAAVEMGALEAVCRGMVANPSSKFVQEAAVVAIGGLCNGQDRGALARRQRAKELGAISLATQAAREHPVSAALESHARAYAVAVKTVRRISAVDEYRGPMCA